MPQIPSGLNPLVAMLGPNRSSGAGPTGPEEIDPAARPADRSFAESLGAAIRSTDSATDARRGDSAEMRPAGSEASRPSARHATGRTRSLPPDHTTGAPGSR